MDPASTDPDQHDDDDPLRQLAAWGRRVDRRERRARAGRRFKRILTAPARRISRKLAVELVVLLAVLVGAAFWYNDRHQSTSSVADGARPYATATHPAGVFATTSATADPAGPFAATPAAHWAEGEAAITLPVATAVTGYTEAEVAAHLLKVKAAMIAGRLDRKMLVGDDPADFLALLAPGSRKHLSDEFQAGRLLTLVTAIDPGAHLDSHPTRASGRTTFSSTKDPRGRNVLGIITNFVWAYGFDNGKVALIHDEIHWVFYRDRDVQPTDRGLWVAAYEGYLSNVDCARFHRGRLAPPGLLGPAGSTTPDPEDPDNYYDPDHTLDILDTCGTPTPSPAA